MIIESITNSTSKTIHVINFDEKINIKVGRAQIAEVRITDISVSRFHSELTLCNDGTVALTDNFSKFGTLLLVDSPLKCDPKSYDVLYLQIGRSLLSISSHNRVSECERLFRCGKNSKKGEGENSLNYEEAAKCFPQEFNWKFKAYEYENPFLASLRQPFENATYDAITEFGKLEICPPTNRDFEHDEFEMESSPR
jgi:pSer/pThr/pTyr-binding forkhead associated (FHA) protein